MDQAKDSLQQTSSTKPFDAHMPALTGIRFFAIFHIFLFHLWAVYNSEKPKGFENVLMGLTETPQTLSVFLSNGWMSTSLFFLLSGFILGYLYWGKDGQLLGSKRRFWLLRLARIYPIHLFVLAIVLFLKVPWFLDAGATWSDIIPVALANLFLVHAWIPPWIPHVNWPTWTISALIFLYLIMPWLIQILGKLSSRQLIIALVAMPFISLLPTVVYAIIIAAGVPWNMSIDSFIANTPLFWVPYFTAGLLMTRIFSLSRFKPIESNRSWFAWGDLAFIVIIVLACIPGIEQPLKFFIRQGLLMPLYIVLVLDLARGNGVMARIFALPGTGFLGETGFSIFMWQGAIMVGCFISISVYPEMASYQHWVAIVMIMVVAIPSTYLFEKPLARLLKRKYINKLD
ncbi:MAG: peptidoglycan/LPS O-acetylase OafA/YrhL [Glaciecola sp.]|jgi:peptidoglycan/LPS O-acetylase OafA/YrhL